jgi:dynein heavy chain, axonemal
MPDYMRILEQAVQFGLPVLLQNVMDKLDAALDPILNKSVIRIGKFVEMSLNEFLLTFPFY